MSAEETVTAGESLTRELAAVVKIAVKDYEYRADNQPVPSDILLSICNVIEAIFIHGIKDTYFLKGSRYAKYPEPNFWPFIQPFLPRNVRSQINQMTQIKNDIGRARAWIRIALNECVMESYVSAFNREKSAVRRFYKRHAYLRDHERVEIFVNQMRGLSRLYFKAPINSSMLNGWTPTPLRLAGYLEQNTQPNTSNYGVPEMEEVIGREDDIPVAVCALDYDGINEQQKEGNYGPVQPVVGSSMAGSIFSNDDRSSVMSRDDEVHSHPSLVDLKFQEIMKFEITADTPSPTLDEKLIDSGVALEPGTGTSLQDVLVFKNVPKPQQTPTKVLVDTCVQASPPETESAMCSANFDDLSFATCNDTFFEASPIKQLETSIEIAPCDPSPSFSPTLGNSLTSRAWSSSDVDGSDASTGFLSQLHEEEQQEDFSSVLRTALDSCEVKDESILEEVSEKEEAAAECVKQGKVGEENAEKSGEAESVKDVGGIHVSATHENDFVVIESSAQVKDEQEKEDKNWRHKLLGIIAHERGLDKQNFQCRSCRRHIGLMYGHFRVCTFDGYYYCTQCHNDFTTTIPAKIVHSWDWKLYKVSRASRAFLDHICDQPLIHLDKINPSLYSHVDTMQNALNLRTKLSYVCVYLLTCRESVAEEMRKRLWPREYLYLNIHAYSYNDLVSCHTGALHKQLETLITFALNHVTNCKLCAQKGFICEICNDPHVIFPFQTEVTVRCDVCFSVYHKKCKEGKPCPKCKRKENYSRERKNSTVVMNNIFIDE